MDEKQSEVWTVATGVRDFMTESSITTSLVETAARVAEATTTTFLTVTRG